MNNMGEFRDAIAEAITILKRDINRVIEAIKGNKPDNSDVVNAVNKVKQVIEEKKEIEIPEQDNSDVVEKLEELKTALEREINVEVPETQVTVENRNTELLEALKAIKIPTIPKMPDNIRALEQIIKKLDKFENPNLKKIEKSLEKLKLDFKVDFPKDMDVNLPPGLIEDGQYLKTRQDQKQVNQMSRLIDTSSANGANLSKELNDIETALDDVSTETKQDAIITEINKIVGFEIGDYDYIALTYVSGGNGDGEIETVIYKDGGAGGTTKATLTLAYDASDRISTITKS